MPNFLAESSNCPNTSYKFHRATTVNIINGFFHVGASKYVNLHHVWAFLIFYPTVNLSLLLWQFCPLIFWLCKFVGFLLIISQIYVIEKKKQMREKIKRKRGREGERCWLQTLRILSLPHLSFSETLKIFKLDFDTTAFDAIAVGVVTLVAQALLCLMLLFL